MGFRGSTGLSSQDLPSSWQPQPLLPPRHAEPRGTGPWHPDGDVPRAEHHQQVAEAPSPRAHGGPTAGHLLELAAGLQEREKAPQRLKASRKQTGGVGYWCRPGFESLPLKHSPYVWFAEQIKKKQGWVKGMCKHSLLGTNPERLRNHSSCRAGAEQLLGGFHRHHTAPSCVA